MKKFFLSFSLLALVLAGTVSCSSDDNSSEKQQYKTLVLTPINGTDVTVNEAVTFVVTVGTEVIEDAQLEVDGKPASNPFTFTAAGTYKVVAKKQGFTDSNSVTIKVEAAQESNAIVGTWIPAQVKVNAMGTTIADMPYPKKEDCQEDTLKFNSDLTVKFDYHSETCEVQSTGASWSLNAAGTVLTMSLFEQSMTVDVVTNTASKLIIKAKGDQFAALIPILVPELAGSITPPMLALTDVQLELNKQ